jgi:O-antigen/teichoic acid export membrane protein
MRDASSWPEPAEGAILQRTARGATIMLGWRMVNRGLGLISTLILVRLLTPDDFGLMSLAAAITATLNSASNLGICNQIVRSRTVSPALYDTGFTLSALRGLLIGTMVFVVAGPAASWFGDPRVRPVLQIIAVIPVIEGMYSMGLVEYRRKLMFGKEFIHLSATRIFQIVTTITSAFIFRDYTALMIGLTASRLFALILSYRMHPYRPRLSLVAWREFFGVSFWAWLVSLANIVRERADTFVIGRLLGVESVGLYAVAEEIATLAITELISPLANACMPGFAAMLRSSDPGAAPAALRRIYAIVILMATPAGFGLSLVAQPLVIAGLGAHWSEAAPLIAVMGITFVPSSLGLIGYALLTAQAAFAQMFTIVALTGAARVAGLLAVGGRYGLLGIAAVAGAVVMTEQSVLAWVAARQVRLPVSTAVLKVAWRPLLAACAMAALLWGLGLGWTGMPLSSTTEALATLAVAVPLGAAVFAVVLGVCWWFSGRPHGGETDLFELMQRSLGTVIRRLGLRRMRGVAS